MCFLGPIGKTPPWRLVGWDIFNFSSETAEHNSMKLDRKQDLNVLYQVCVFEADRKSKVAALASDWLRHYWLQLLKPLNGIQWNLTGSKIFTSSSKFVFLGLIRKARWPLIGWDILDLLKLLNRIQRNLTGSKISTSSTKFVFFGSIRKKDGHPGQKQNCSFQYR